MRRRWLLIGFMVVLVPLAGWYWLTSSQVTTGEIVPEATDSYLAFLHHSGGRRFDLYLLNTENGDTIRLTRGQSTHEAHWLDSETLSFLVNESPHTLNITTGEFTDAPRWDRRIIAPDETQFVEFVDRSLIVQEFDAESAADPIIDPVGFTNINLVRAYVDWSPDSRQLAVVDRYPTEAGDQLFESDLTMLPLDGSASTRIERSGIQTFPLWSPDGEKLIFRDDILGEYDDTVAQDVVLYDPATGDATIIVENTLRYQPIYWTADSAQLIYVTNPNICILDIDTDEADCSLIGTDPVLHSDGERLAYRGFNQDAQHVAICVSTLATDETCYLDASWGEQIFPIGWQPQT